MSTEEETVTTKRGRPAGASRKERPRRSSPGGYRSILTVEGKDPAYEYRWVMDTDEGGARIWKMKDIGYEFAAAADHRIGENAVFKSKSHGSVIRVPADKEGNFMYLMRIDKDWYDEDKASHEEKIKRVERSMYREYDEDKDEGQYGKIDSSSGFARSVS